MSTILILDDIPENPTLLPPLLESLGSQLHSLIKSDVEPQLLVETVKSALEEKPEKDTFGDLDAWDSEVAKILARTLTKKVNELEKEITERKQAEKKIAYQAYLLENVNDAVVGIDEKMVIRFWNKGAERLFGWKSEEVVGRAGPDILRSEFIGTERKDVLQILADQGRWKGEAIQYHKEGMQVTVEVSSMTLRDDNGTITGYVSVNRDITKRKREEKELLLLNEELEQRVVRRTHLFEVANRRLENSRKEIQNILDSMSTLNAKVALDGTLLFVNKIAAQASGLPVDELMKTNFLEGPWWAFDPEVQQRVKEAFAQAQAGVTVNYDERIFVFDQILAINFSLTPMFGEEGRVEYVLAEGRDITRRIHAEEEVHRLNQNLERRAIELETVNKELESFSYSVSHDLRAPLRSIDGFSHALLEDYNEQLPQEGQDYLKSIRAAAQRMAELIDSLLSLARVTRTSVELGSVNLSTLAESVFEALQREQPDRRVSFKVAENLIVSGDRQLLRIALENLIGNAWKFTSKKDTGYIEVGLREDAGETVYFIRDNGAGFDMTYKDKLFGTFQRLHTASEFPGTGIGLATVQRIIHRHNGRIWAESIEGNGTTFYFTIPDATNL